jgi:hypothetical protein
MLCKNCNIDAELYRMIISSGVTVIVERCPICGRNPNKGRPFISKSEVKDFHLLPLLEDMTPDAPACEYIGCQNKGSEYHHYAPRHLFEDADNWGTGYLCKYHHALWHKVTATGSYAKRRQPA